MRYSFFAIATTMIIVLGACQDSGFKGNSQAAVEPPPPPPPTPTNEPAEACDPTKDKVAIQFPPGKIRDCVEQGNIWNFKLRTCSPVQKATSYDCSFKGIEDYANGELLLGISMDNKRSRNAKLLACGEVPGRAMILIQGWYATEEVQDCEFKRNMTIFTECYQLFEDGEPAGWSGLSKEEKVSRCLTNDYNI